MRRCEKHLALVMLISGVLAGFVFQNNLGFILSTIVDILVILLPLVTFAVLLSVSRVVSQRCMRQMVSYSAKMGSFFILSLFLVIAVAWLMDRWKVDAVETYVLHAVPVLEQIKAQSGKYPSQLPTKLIGKPPFLLRYYGSYTATSDSFCFEYINEPAGWAGGEGALKFESFTRRWVAER